MNEPRHRVTVLVPSPSPKQHQLIGIVERAPENLKRFKTAELRNPDEKDYHCDYWYEENLDGRTKRCPVGKNPPRLNQETEDSDLSWDWSRCEGCEYLIEDE